jgi:hypothetical protein
MFEFRGNMDLNELLKAAPHLQSIATTIVAGVPLAEIVKRIVLPSADVLGKRMADRVERCFAKAAKMIEDAGVTPQPVEDKLVIEILRGASLEDDENLHDMWAALLGNAASPEKADRVRPSFVAILRQMASDEAALLNWMYEYLNAKGRLRFRFFDIDLLANAYFQLGFDPDDNRNVRRSINRVTICLDGLEAGRLVNRHTELKLSDGDSEVVDTETPTYSFTDRGLEFIQTCRPPAPKK